MVKLLDHGPASSRPPAARLPAAAVHWRGRGTAPLGNRLSVFDHCV